MRLGVIATVSEAPALLVLATAAASADVTIDCAETERCDAAAMQVLVALRAEVLRKGHAFHLVNVPAHLRWRFEAVGLNGGDDDRAGGHTNMEVVA
jgi:anti-anti-sigma regulatory factor